MNAPFDLPDFLQARRDCGGLQLAFVPGQRPFSIWAQELRDLWTARMPLGDATGVVDGEAVRLTLPTGAVTEGRLVFPKGQGPFRAVLLLHDHGGRFDIGWQKNFDLPVSADSRAKHYEGLAFADALLARGMAVLSVDALGWGSRYAGGAEAQQALAAAAMGLGWSLAGIHAAEDAAAAAWLADHPRVSDVVACGFSMGGFRAWQVGALSPAVSAVASVGWMACRADLMADGAPLLLGQAAYHFLHPEIAGQADFPDLAGLAAGKRMFFASGRGDPHMPEASVQKAWDHIAQMTPIETLWHDHAHTCPVAVQTACADFLAG